MFCGKCGKENADDTMFCSGCGAKLKEGQAVENGTSVVINQNDKNRKVGMIVVGVVTVIVVIAAAVLLSGRSYKTTVEKMFDAQFSADAESVLALLPKEVLDYALEEEGYDEDELDDFIDEGNEMLQDQLDYIESYLGEDWEVSYEIVSAEDVTEDELDDLQEEYEDIDVKVSAAKNVEVETTIKGGEEEQSMSQTVCVIKIGRSWYLHIL